MYGAKNERVTRNIYITTQEHNKSINNCILIVYTSNDLQSKLQSSLVHTRSIKTQQIYYCAMITPLISYISFTVIATNFLFSITPPVLYLLNLI